MPYAPEQSPSPAHHVHPLLLKNRAASDTMRACVTVTFLALCLLINSVPLRWQWTENSVPPSPAEPCHFSVACSRPFTSTASLYPPPEGMRCPKPMPLSPYLSPNFARLTFQSSGSWHLLPPGCPTPTATLLRLAILREVLYRSTFGGQEEWFRHACGVRKAEFLKACFILWKHVKKKVWSLDSLKQAFWGTDKHYGVFSFDDVQRSLYHCVKLKVRLQQAASFFLAMTWNLGCLSTN